MVELWFAILCVTLILFVVLDGWNIGAGVLHLVVAKSDRERREVIAALGPSWSWNEVWLLAAGGTFVLAFPRILAVSFAGFYLALWLVLWSFVLRGISIEVGGHIRDTLWQSAWDFVFALSSVLLAVLFGAAFGNVIRGVPLDATGHFSMSLFTDFGVRGRVGILDWYTLSVAVFATALLAAHGGTYLTLKTTGRVHERSELWARRLWAATAVLFVIITLQTQVVRPDLYRAMIAAAIRVDLMGAHRRRCLGNLDWVARTCRATRVCGLLCRHYRSVAGRRGERLSGDAPLDAGARAFPDHL